MKRLNVFLWSQPAALLVLTTAFWAGNVVISKMAVGEVSPGVLAFSRWALLGSLLPVLYWREVRAGWPVLRSRWRYLVLMGGIGLAMFNLLFYISAHHTTAVNIGIVQGAIPIIVLVGAFYFFGSRLNWIQSLGVALGVVGVVIVALRGIPGGLADITLNRGDILMTTACLFYAGYTLGLKSRPAVSGIVLVTFFCVPAAVASTPAVFYEWWSDTIVWPSLKGWLIISYVTLFPSFVAQVFFLRSVDLIGPARCGMFVNLTPIFAALLAVVILGEVFRFYHASALALVLIGLWLSRERALTTAG